MPEPMRADDDDADSIMMEYLDSLSPEAQAYIHEFGFDAEHFRDWVIVRRMRMTPAQWLARQEAEEQEKHREIATRVIAKIIGKAPPAPKSNFKRRI